MESEVMNMIIYELQIMEEFLKRNETLTTTERMEQKLDRKMRRS